MKFRIQKRLYSSDVIEASDDGKNWSVYLIPGIKKDKGDPLCEKLLILLDPTLTAELIEEAVLGVVKSHHDWANRFNIRGEIRKILKNEQEKIKY